MIVSARNLCLRRRRRCCCCCCCCSTMDDEGIGHRTLAVNGINMHVAEKGQGPVVLLIHGFPETWYAWRHQIASLAALGYRAVAPDLRGYGDTDVPPSVTSYSILHMVGDIVALIDSLGQEQVFVVGHDWGALVAWSLCQFRADKVKAMVALSVPFTPRNPTRKSVDYLRSTYGDDYYICRFQEPGAIESEFARLGTALVLKKFLTYRTPGPLFIPKEGWGSPDEQIPLPSWISELGRRRQLLCKQIRQVWFHWRTQLLSKPGFKLGTDCSVDGSTHSGSGEVHCRRSGPDLQFPWDTGLHSQRWFKEECSSP
ncbi:uncharacterized protein M6B38_148795 [Iris pallida]|uniref:AB hydrolase-1 domain-containing protein n=1 Tax=Iris pallida TaxID=29817 RepID=A0AAX6F9Q3_IRIPA|nr:uncharacterized protein M6B38_148795 [Iris pallida]